MHEAWFLLRHDVWKLITDGQRKKDKIKKGTGVSFAAGSRESGAIITRRPRSSSAARGSRQSGVRPDRSDRPSGVHAVTTPHSWLDRRRPRGSRSEDQRRSRNWFSDESSPRGRKWSDEETESLDLGSASPRPPLASAGRAGGEAVN